MEVYTLKPVYVGLGLFFFALGAAGAVLPLLPSTPFLLLSAFFFARGSDRFNQWFISTRLYKNHLESLIRTRSMKLPIRNLPGQDGVTSALLMTEQRYWTASVYL
ncbi:YbaN family protein [Paenibacillus enshidis]|uniref:YbaN family protein n=1 Tax=Paenibacillus enshidis TaxID=1458439 RepID=UPI0040558608